MPPRDRRLRRARENPLLEYYLNLSYPIRLSHQSDDGDEYWFAEIPQLPGVYVGRV